jgi:hypothetical protein
MPSNTPDDSRVVSVRLPTPLLQRLDRLLDWHTTHRQRPTTRNAALRAALGDWLDQQEQLAGLLDSQVLRQQFHAAYTSLRPSATGVPIYRLRRVLQWPRERFDTVLKPCVPPRSSRSRRAPSRWATTLPPTTVTRGMANIMTASAGALEPGARGRSARLAVAPLVH